MENKLEIIASKALNKEDIGVLATKEDLHEINDKIDVNQEQMRVYIDNTRNELIRAHQYSLKHFNNSSIESILDHLDEIKKEISQTGQSYMEPIVLVDDKVTLINTPQ